ncbi:MAG: hypothetical protein HYW06_03405 [Gemmatimonadetes bacterium]|nr:hypothetical protein [Gemmatimonadota bacterium]MBI2402377.1 hypothetical protein [Gemmatimonadota bacterium]MBI2536012.1 hypothetical protein [Gemmatimonadota bacterium]
MSLRPHASMTQSPGPYRTPAVRRWRPADVVALVAVVCYGAAALIVAAGLFVRLASHP